MNRLFRNLLLILALAGLWAISGYVIGVALEAFGIPYPSLKVILASLNVILGLLLFQGITHDPTAERIFFNGPEAGKPGDLRIGCLWALPISLLISGFFLWAVAIVTRLIFSR